MPGENGHRNHFGDEAHQEILPDVADRVLKIVRARHPYIFGAALSEALTGIRFVDTAPRDRTDAEKKAVDVLRRSAS